MKKTGIYCLIAQRLRTGPCGRGAMQFGCSTGGCAYTNAKATSGRKPQPPVMRRPHEKEAVSHLGVPAWSTEPAAAEEHPRTPDVFREPEQLNAELRQIEMEERYDVLGSIVTLDDLAKEAMDTCRVDEPGHDRDGNVTFQTVAPQPPEMVQAEPPPPAASEITFSADGHPVELTQPVVDPQSGRVTLAVDAPDASPLLTPFAPPPLTRPPNPAGPPDSLDPLAPFGGGII